MKSRTRQFVSIFHALLVADRLNLCTAVNERVEVSPEVIYRETVSAWQKSMRTNDWSPWHSFSETLWEGFSNPTAASSHRLQIVGALEEGILVIEKAIFQQGQGANAVRDRTLSKLYTTYSKALTHLSSSECQSLALDPHTLLIGAETVRQTDPASTHLCVENAENSLRNAASLDATNAEVEVLLQIVTGNSDTVHQRKPKEFVTELFDSFADTFDDKLLKDLEYKVPSLIGSIAASLRPKGSSYRAILDAGCGTGLAGRHVRSLISGGHMIGVDASQKMLDKAAKCTLTSGCGLKVAAKAKKNDPPLYEGLVQMDLEEMTIPSLMRATGLTLPQGFDLILAADVLVYFGNLHDLIRTFSTVANPSGSHLMFSCELATPEEAPLGWRLLSTGRFAHTKEHAVAVAKQFGYELVHYQEITPRMEKGEPVKGHLFAFHRKGSTRVEL